MCFLGGGCIAPVGQARNMFSKKTRRGVFLRLQNHSAPEGAFTRVVTGYEPMRGSLVSCTAAAVPLMYCADGFEIQRVGGLESPSSLCSGWPADLRTHGGTVPSCLKKRKYLESTATGLLLYRG